MKTHAEIIYWLVDVMQADQTYNITKDQANQIKEVWQVLQLDPDNQYKFNEDLTQVKKFTNDV